MTDIKLDDDLELEFVNGDFNISEGLNQHIELILRANKGEFKESPLIGYFIEKDLKSNLSQTEIEANVALALKADSIKVNSVKIVNGSLEIDAE